MIGDWTRVLSSLAARFTAAPGHPMLTGGAVRDLLLGRTPRDVDLLIAAKADEEPVILRALASLSGMEPVLFGRKEPSTRRIVVDGIVVDTTFHRPGLLRGALERRDFTINAMAMPLAGLAEEPGGSGASDGLEALLIDPFGGLGDLRAGRIRAVNDHALDDDPLRMLRAVRLASTLDGFGIEDALMDAIGAAASRIVEPAAERVQSEIERILESPRAGPALRTMEALGILAPLLPELAPLSGLSQPARHHDHDVFEHTLRAVEAADALARGAADVGVGPLGPGETVILKWAALLHDVGKAATVSVGEDGARHFYGHETVSASLAEDALRRLRVPARIAEPVVKLVDLHLRLGALATAGSGDRPIRRLVRAAGERLPLLVLLSLADRRSAGGERSEEKDAALVAVCRRALALRPDVEAALESPPLLDGREIMEILALPPGPRIGSIARWLERLRAEGGVTTKEEAETLLRSLPPARTRD